MLYPQYIDIRALLFCTVLCLTSTLSYAGNIEFLDKKTIERLSDGIFEVVAPKNALESDKIRYAKDLPFDRLSYKERNEKFFGLGTAFLIDDKRLISAAHVFSLDFFSLIHDEIVIRDSKGNIYQIDNVYEYSTVRDMIVFDLKEYPKNIRPLKMNKEVGIGDTVFSIGNVQGEGISFRAGQVASFTVEEQMGLWENIRFTSPASPGNSGGPLVNVHGEVVGLIVQKNESENHNIAYPIQESEKLSGNADFFYRNIGMHLNDEQNSLFKDWDASFELPAKIPDLAHSAQQSLNEFYTKLGVDIGNKYQDIYFPKGKWFKDYLRNQTYVRHFGTLTSDADFKNWNLRSYQGKTIPVKSDQRLTVSMSEIADLHTVIEKPSGTPLKEFITNQKLMMDTLLQGLPIKRDVGVEQVRVTSFGEPEKTSTWKDKLGRVWTSSLWFIDYEDSFLYSHCLPYPKGVICNIDVRLNEELFLGYFDLVQQNYNEIATGYVGEIKDWMEYFSLERKYLPESMRSIKVSMDDNLFEMNGNRFGVKLKNSNVTKDSVLHFHYGYAAGNPFEEDLLLYELYPEDGGSISYRIQKYFTPAESSDSYKKSIWHDILNSSGDYNGELVEKEGRFYVSLPRNKTKSVTDDGVESIYVIRCIHTKSSDDILEQCNRHASGVEFF